MEFCKSYNEKATLIYHIVRFWEGEKTGEHVEMRVEKENEPDVYAEFTLPAYHCHHAYGFKESELDGIETFMRNNSVSIWDMARETCHA